MTERPIESATLEVVYADGDREVLKIERREGGEMRGEVKLSTQWEKVDILEWASGAWPEPDTSTVTISGTFTGGLVINGPTRGSAGSS